MTLKEFLAYQEHKFDDPEGYLNPYRQIYANGWRDAVKEIRTVLELNGFDLDIPLG